MPTRSRPSARSRASAPLPRAVGALAAVALVFVAMPLIALLWRVPWSQFGHHLASAPARTALWLSTWTSIVATVATVIVGVPLGLVIAKSRSRAGSFVHAVMSVTMVFPPVVGGVALLFAFGRRGLFGVWLDRWFGLTIPFTPLAVILAQVMVALPFVVLTIEGAARDLDGRVDEAARSLGARPWFVLRHITLASIWPSLLAATTLAWARALGEFGATITFAGSFPGRTQTLPMTIYSSLETDPGAALSMSAVMIVVSALALFSLRGRVMGGQLMGGQAMGGQAMGGQASGAQASGAQSRA